MIERAFFFGGALSVRKLTGWRWLLWRVQTLSDQGYLGWKIRNTLTWNFLRGWFAAHVAAPLANLCGVTTIMSDLRLIVIRKNGERVDLGVVSHRVVTDAGVTFLRDDWNNNAADLTTLNYHGLGTGTNAEAAGDTALQTECTTALNPDSTRATGTRATPAANQYRSTGTLTFDASAAVTEHGLLSQAGTGGGTLWDRSVFAAVNVVSGDSIQAQYTVTLSSGG